MNENEEAILNAHISDNSPFQNKSANTINRYLRREHELLTRGYVLTEEDYRVDIYPNLCRFGFFPDPGKFTWDEEKMEQIVFNLSSSDYDIHTDARHKLFGHCDVYVITEIVKTMRTNYERLKCAKLASHDTVHFLKNYKACKICNELFSPVSVQDALTEYRTASIRFPHEVPWEDVVQYCPGPHIITTSRNPFGDRK